MGLAVDVTHAHPKAAQHFELGGATIDGSTFFEVHKNAHYAGRRHAAIEMQGLHLKGVILDCRKQVISVITKVTVREECNSTIRIVGEMGGCWRWPGP